jgi:hypothetical protein
MKLFIVLLFSFSSSGPNSLLIIISLKSGGPLASVYLLWIGVGEMWGYDAAVSSSCGLIRLHPVSEEPNCTVLRPNVIDIHALV